MPSILSGLELPTALTFSYGVGRAAGGVLEPQLQGLKNTSWEAVTGENVSVPPPAFLLAEGVAQGKIDPKTAALWATWEGIAGPQFDAMVNIAKTVPGAAQLLFLWRNGTISKTTWELGMKYLGFRDDFVPFVAEIFSVPVTAEQAAILVQRSVIPNQGQLPFDTDIPPGNVPRMPKVDLDAYASAQAYGVGNDQLDALTRIVGLPASPDLAARMTYRNIITRDDFTSAIAEGNTRQEWADVLFDGFRQIPTAEQFVEARLRGWIDDDAMYAGTALWGMSQAHTDLEFKIHRRPLTPHAITTGLARGGTFQPASDEIQDPYEASVHQANLGPEWYDLAIANKYTIPSYFVLRALLQAGTITKDEGETYFLWLGWPPDLAEKAATAYAVTGTGATDTHITKAENQLWTATHSSYVKGRTDDATATAKLTKLGVAPGAISQVLALWAEEGEIARAGLTAAQIKKAYAEGTFTQDEAVARLVELGWSVADATVYLGE